MGIQYSLPILGTLSLIYKQPRFLATSLELKWLLILVASIPKI